MPAAMERAERVAGLAAADFAAQDAVDELRQLAHGIHPAVLSRSGLVPALASLAEESEIEGLVATRRVKEAFPTMGVVVLLQYVEPAYALELIEQNPEGVGYLLKERVVDGAILVDALRRVIDGETVVDPTIVARLLGRKRRHDPLAELTDREREVPGLVAEGLSNRAIGARLVVTDRTVESHMTQVFSKLGLEETPDQHRRVLAVLTRCGRRPTWPTRSSGGPAQEARRDAHPFVRGSCPLVQRDVRR